MSTKFNKCYTELDKDLFSRLDKEHRLEVKYPDMGIFHLKDLYVTDYILQQVKIFAYLVNAFYMDDFSLKETIQVYVEDRTYWFPDTEGLSKRELLAPCFEAGHLDRFLEILEHIYNILQEPPKPNESKFSRIPDYSEPITPFKVFNCCSDCILKTPLSGRLAITNSYFTCITVKPSNSYASSRTFLNSYCNITVLSDLHLFTRKVKFRNSYVSVFYKDSFNIVSWVLQTNLSAIIDTLPLDEMLGVLDLTEKNNETIDIELLKERGSKTLLLEYNNPRFNLSEEENRKNLLPTVTYDNDEYNLGSFNPTAVTSVFTVSEHVFQMHVLESEALVIKGVYNQSKVLVNSPDFSLEIDSLRCPMITQEQQGQNFRFNTEYELVALENEIDETERAKFALNPRTEGDSEVFSLSPETISFLKSVKITYSSTFSPK